MKTIERRKAIVDYLKTVQECSVSSISERFDVTSATIRRDLSVLEANSYIKRTHGAVHIIAKPEISVQGYYARSTTHAAEKLAIAKEAAKLVRDGDTIILDSGTTTQHIVAELKSRKGITVISNSVSFVGEITPDSPSVILSGGILDSDNLAMIGPDAEAFFDKFSASTIFLAATGVQATGGLMAATPFQAGIKQKMLHCAQKCVLLADSSKFCSGGMQLFASFQDVDILITDSPIVDRELRQVLEQCNVEVICANCFGQNE